MRWQVTLVLVLFTEAIVLLMVSNVLTRVLVHLILLRLLVKPMEQMELASLFQARPLAD